MHINTSTRQHFDVLGIITALVCVWKPNPLGEVTSVHLWCLTKKTGSSITDMLEPIWYLSCSIMKSHTHICQSVWFLACMWLGFLFFWENFVHCPLKYNVFKGKKYPTPKNPKPSVPIIMTIIILSLSVYTQSRKEMQLRRLSRKILFSKTKATQN